MQLLHDAETPQKTSNYSSFYLAENTLRPEYKDQVAYAIQSNSCYILLELYKLPKYSHSV